MSLLDYWSEWPPVAELHRGFVGYKPAPKEERQRRQQFQSGEAQRMFGAGTPYASMPQWLREAHAKNRK